MTPTTWIGAALALTTLTGCASLNEGHPMLPMGQVKDVQTDYSLGLSCLGQRIDRSGRGPVQVFVDPIRDMTVPSGYEERRLSSGGKWWLITALQKIDAHRIEVVTQDGS